MKMKSLLFNTLSFLFFGNIAVYAQLPEPVFFEDFSDGIPETFTLIDFDGFNPEPDLNFPKGEAWASWTDPDDTDNKIAASVSWYESNGSTSNDWIITPLITLPDDDSSCQLYFRARSAVSTFKDAFQVAVATATDEKAADLAKENDKWNVVKQVNNSDNNAEWTTYKIDLSAYHGTSIYLAFINVTTDGWMCYIDDITVGEEASVKPGDIHLLSLPFAANGSAVVKADLHVGILNNLTTFKARITMGDEVMTEDVTGDFAVNKHYDIALKNLLHGEEATKYAYKVELLNADDLVFAADSSEVMFTKAISGEQCVVAEGLHDCNDSFGPRMIEGYKWAKEQFGDRLIGLSLHASQYDPHHFAGQQKYYKLLDQTFDLTPNQTILVGRRTKGEVYDDIEKLCQADLQDRILMAAPRIDGVMSDEDLQIQTSCTFAVPLTDLSYSYTILVTEDSLWTVQSNMYAGGDLFGKFCGYEDMPLNANVRVDNVVRAIYSDKSMVFSNDVAAGEEVELPSIEVDFEESPSMKFECGEPRHLFATILIVDDTTGEIVNAARSPLKYTGNLEPTGISELTDMDNVYVEVYDMSGRKVSAGTQVNGERVQVPEAVKGSMFIVKKVSNGKAQTFKVRR